jgi:arsenate reductase-like glutaredoxin family protein
LRSKKAEIEERDFAKAPLTEAELDRLIGPRNHLDFLSTRNALYKERRMDVKPPSRKEALALMAKEPNLLKRPILVAGRKVLIGFKQEEWKDAVG